VYPKGIESIAMAAIGTSEARLPFDHKKKQAKRLSMRERDIADRAVVSSHNDMFTNVTNGPVKTVSKTTSAVCNR
jgi:hypothetical protein